MTLIKQSLFFICLILILFCTTGAAAAPAEDPPTEAQRIRTMMSKVINAYGGQKAVSRIHSLYANGKIEAFMMHDEGSYDLYFQRERKLRIETKYRRSAEVRLLNGEKGYRTSKSNAIEEVHGPKFLSMVYQYKHLNILHDLSGDVYEISSVNRAVVSGRDSEVFRLTDKEGAVIDIAVDDSSSFILKVTAYFREGSKQIDLSAEFSDFRKVEDSVFPFVVTNYAGGVKVARTVFEKYSINPDIPDSFFAPSIIQSL
jgi:outer membrane lipoprotein-sorting protein